MKGLDLKFYFRLSLAPAKRMYRFLDKRFGAKSHDVWKFELRDFACEHIGFSRNYDNAQLKRKMRPSILELEEKGFLEPMEDDARFLRGQRRGEVSVVFEKKKPDLPAAQPEKPAVAALTPAELALTARGVTAATAAELVAAHPAERIAACLEIFDWLTEQADKRVGRSPAGFLVKSIRDGYEPPKGFEPRSEQERRSRAADDARRVHREQAADARRRERADDDRRSAERSHIDRCLAGLSAAGRQALEDRAVANAAPEDRDRLTNDLFGGIMRRMLTEQQILRESPCDQAT